MLAEGDVGDSDGLTGRLRAQVEDRLQSVFAFNGNIHSARAPIGSIQLESRKSVEGSQGRAKITMPRGHLQSQETARHRKNLKSLNGPSGPARRRSSSSCP